MAADQSVDDGWKPDSTTPTTPGGGDGWQPASTTPVSTSGFKPTSAKPVDTSTFAVLKNKARVVRQQAQATSRTIAHSESNLRKNWQYLQQHPVEDLFNVLGAGQRAVGAVVGGNERHENFLQILGRVGHDVFHPGDRDAAGMDANARDTESIRALVHAPTHAAIDQFVKAHVPKELQPYASGIMRGAEDFGLQTLSDPLTYAGGLGGFERLAKAAGVLVHGASAAKALAYLAHSQQALKFMPWLKDLAKAYDKAAGAAATVFHARPELDNVVNEQGRAARLQIENKHLTIAQKNRAADHAALSQGGPSLTQRVQQYVQAMRVSPQSARNIMQRFANSSPDEQAQMLAKMRQKLAARNVAQETAQHLAQHGGYKPGVQPMSADDWHAFAQTQSKTLQEYLKGHGAGRAILYLTSIPRTLQQASLFLNPLPHGIKNVGTLAFLAGGPKVVPRAVKSMVTGVDAATRTRLERIGLEPGYTRELQNTLWSHIIPGWDQTAGTLQEAMGRMEESWRAALLEQLDKRLGPSRNAQDELMKGYMVNQRLGDYRNQAAFVQLFQMMGGPWVAFRLGIVPKNVLKAIQEHPERVLAIVRAQEDLQHNRSAAGQHDNALQFGGPVDDFAKLASNPAAYLESPSSGGAIAQGVKAADQLGYESVGKVAGGIAEQYNPLGGVLGGSGSIAGTLAGRGMPAPNGPHGSARFQQQSLADRLLTATLATLAMYYEKKQSHASQQYQKREDKRIEQQGF